MNRYRLHFFAFLALLASAFAQEIPPALGRLNDFARALSAKEAAEIAANLAALDTRTGVQLAVVTVSSLQGYPAEKFARKVGDTWGVGRRGLNDGIVLLVAPTERKVFIATGPGIRDRIPDSVVNEIVQERILPQFRAGKISAGISAGVQAIVQRLDPPPAAKQTAPLPPVASAKSVAEATGSPLATAEETAAWIVAGWIVGGIVLVAIFGFWISAIVSRRTSCFELHDACAQQILQLERLAASAKEALRSASGTRGGSWQAQSEKDYARHGAPIVIDGRRVELGAIHGDIGFSIAGLDGVYRHLQQLSKQLRASSKRLQEVKDEAIDGAARFRDKERDLAALERGIAAARGFVKDARIALETRKQIEVTVAAALETLAQDGSPNWHGYLVEVSNRNKALSKLSAAAQSEIDAFVRAPAESARLLKELPTQIAALDEKIRRSNGARKDLEDARSKLAQAQSQISSSSPAGMSGTDWLLVYMLLSNSQTSVASAASKETAAVEDYAREQSSSYYGSSASSSSEACSFGGGGGFDSGGGGGGSW